MTEYRDMVDAALKHIRYPKKKVRSKPRRKGKRMPVKFKTEWGQKFPDGREVCDRKTTAGRLEYENRTDQMVMRQGGNCACGTPLRAHSLRFGYLFGERPTFGHDIPRGMGGGLRDDRIVDDQGNPMNHAECWDCNGEKGSKRL